MLIIDYLKGEHKVEETKHWLEEKGSEALAKGTEILDATQHALATGAAVVTEKAKQGLGKASEAAHIAQSSSCLLFSSSFIVIF